MPVLSKHPDWPGYLIGETVTLKCTIQEGRASDWEYSWWKDNNNINIYSGIHEYVILVKGPSEKYPSGQYKCTGRRKQDQQLSKFSNPITMIFKGVVCSV